MSLISLIQKYALLLYLSVAGCGSSSSPQTNYVQHLQQRTDQQGEVSFPERNVRAVVRNEDGNPLPNINVHYAFKDNKNVVLAIDPSGNYIPERAVFSGESLSARRGSRRYAATVGEFIEFVLENRKTVDEIVEQLSTPHSGDVLGEANDVNIYCMTLEQITKKTIDVPAGLVLLAPEAAGVNTTLVRRAATALLGEIAERHIISRYGKQAGYEVWVPRTAMSVCGEEFEDIVCDISGGQLEQIWNPELPYWRINGACTPSTTQGCSGEVLFEDEFDGKILDVSKWDIPKEIEYPLRDGILEMISNSILTSRSTYTLDDRTLCFEARWRVREREGTNFGLGLVNGDGEHGSSAFNVGYGRNDLVCSNYTAKRVDDISCDADVTAFLTTRFILEMAEINYFINNDLVATSTMPPATDREFFIDVGCGSADETEKSCSIDSIKLTKE